MKTIDKDMVKLTQLTVGCAASIISFVQDHAPNLKTGTDREIWSPQTVLDYRHARDAVLHQLSGLIDKKVLGIHHTPEEIEAIINRLLTCPS